MNFRGFPQVTRNGVYSTIPRFISPIPRRLEKTGIGNRHLPGVSFERFVAGLSRSRVPLTGIQLAPIQEKRLRCDPIE